MASKISSKLYPAPVKAIYTPVSYLMVLSVGATLGLILKNERAIFKSLTSSSFVRSKIKLALSLRVS
jgi:hypothetical protein